MLVSAALDRARKPFAGLAGAGEAMSFPFWDTVRIVTAPKKTKKKEVLRSSTGPAPATAAAILGNTPGRLGKGSTPGVRPVKPEWRKYQERLLELRAQLLQQRDGLAKDSAQEMASYSLHMADSGTDAFDRDFALSLLSSDQDAIFEIDQALQRMERKTYGICELTSKPIPKARLEAIPWTRFTVQAQAQLEREGAMRQRRLGSLGTIESGGMAEPEPEEAELEEKPAKEKE
jgi:RNA polymerase-binding transcription factor DksA